MVCNNRLMTSGLPTSATSMTAIFWSFPTLINRSRPREARCTSHETCTSEPVDEADLCTLQPPRAGRCMQQPDPRKTYQLSSIEPLHGHACIHALTQRKPRPGKH